MQNMSTRVTWLFATVIPFFIFSCRQPHPEKDRQLPVEKKPGGRMTDLEGALAYEFNMVKNPATGLIPDGVREGELEQARQIRERQFLNGRIMTNAYFYQGPNNLGGRTRSIVYDVRFNGTSNQVIMAGGVSGGVYKSTDNGATWVRKSPVGQHFSCTSIAQDPRPGFEDTWYYGVGEASGNSAGASGAFYSGNGVYKSTDNGETWTRLTGSNGTPLESFSTATDFINKIIVDPTNGNVYIACPATILRSTDGGTSWNTVLSGSLASTNQHTDIVVSSTGVFYASFAGVASLSAVDGVWSSASGASGTWTRIAGAGSGGSPTGWNSDNNYGRVVLALAPSSENILYALYWNGTSFNCPSSTPEAELFRWDEITDTWTNLSASLPNETGCSVGNDPFAVQGGYDLVIAVKPDDPSVLFLGGTNIYRSDDAGSSWTRIGGYAGPSTYSMYTNSHPDIHAIVFSPVSSTTMLCGNDGGIQRTTNNLAGSVSWTPINTGYRTFQYYYVDIDPRTGNDKVIGGAQDNGSTRNIGGTGSDYEMVVGGDGVSVGLTDLIAGTQYEYVGSQLGNIVRRASTSGLGFGTTITPTGESNSGMFVTLFKLDPDNSERLYYANDNLLYRTTSASTVTSATWTQMTGIGTAVGAANDITCIALSRGTYNASTSSLFFGTNTGRVFRMDDPTGVAAATAPVEITGGSFPAGYVSSIAVNPRNDDTLLVTFSSYGVVSAWWTGNANSATPTWTAVEGALTLPSYRTAAIHTVPNSPEVHYFVGTSAGLYTSTGLPGAVNWSQEAASELGNAVVTSLSYRPADANLLVGTHGYGMWKTSLNLVPLPVELTDFKGTLQTDKKVLLEWTTASEFNSLRFELEKSYDGAGFRRIATLPAAGISHSTLQYQYTDREPLSEHNYYRLKSIDADHDSRYSPTILVKLPGAQQDFYILGNPVQDRVRIRFVKPVQKEGEIRLVDMSGRVITRRQLATGIQQTELNLEAYGLRPGTYILQVMADGTLYSRKLLKE